MKKDFEDPQVSWAQFSNASAGRIVLTHEREAVLWDTESDRALLRLPFGDKGCAYRKNRSFFSPTDDQILSGTVNNIIDTKKNPNCTLVISKMQY